MKLNPTRMQLKVIYQDQNSLQDFYLSLFILRQVQAHNNTYNQNNSILTQDRYQRPLLSFQQFPLHHSTIFKLALIKQGHHESLE